MCKTLVPLKVLIIALLTVNDVRNSGRKQKKNLFLKAKKLLSHVQRGQVSSQENRKLKRNRLEGICVNETKRDDKA